MLSDDSLSTVTARQTVVSHGPKQTAEGTVPVRFASFRRRTPHMLRVPLPLSWLEPDLCFPFPSHQFGNATNLSSLRPSRSFVSRESRFGGATESETLPRRYPPSTKGRNRQARERISNRRPHRRGHPAQFRPPAME